MCTEDIFRATLEELAQEGNERAKLALKLAEKFPTTEQKYRDACKALKEAHSILNSAISINEYEWTAKTDRYIRNAQTSIANAMIHMK